uniref:Uncharacterized protein n=1 Tax=Megaselia scalaris TaxID=36166 RepID=T1GHB7_MEGSC
MLGTITTSSSKPAENSSRNLKMFSCDIPKYVSYVHEYIDKIWQVIAGGGATLDRLQSLEIWKSGTFLRLAMASIMDILKIKPFVEVSVGQLLWGYEDPLLKLAKDVVPKNKNSHTKSLD